MVQGGQPLELEEGGLASWRAVEPLSPRSIQASLSGLPMLADFGSLTGC